LTHADDIKNDNGVNDDQPLTALGDVILFFTLQLQLMLVTQYDTYDYICLLVKY